MRQVQPIQAYGIHWINAAATVRIASQWRVFQFNSGRVGDSADV
jgi:hypothetical protein